MLLFIFLVKLLRFINQFLDYSEVFLFPFRKIAKHSIAVNLTFKHKRQHFFYYMFIFSELIGISNLIQGIILDKHTASAREEKVDIYPMLRSKVMKKC
ncbi:MAG: hypothetical protein KAW12_22755 [Candidatus Aminicenantes bacterium]|nr:hypothetical protein [Candidatus Aminicenantes bacterium]